MTLLHYRFAATEAPVADWVPSVDVQEAADRWVVRADVPGVDPAQIEVSLADGALTIQGTRPDERRGGRFFRSFTLPDSADAAGIKAASKHGVLELTIPKQPKVLPKRIAVNG